MKSLFLFFTQSEMGAPDYLSRTGEQGAETLTETIISFLSETLKINIQEKYDIRAKSLNEDVIWRSFKEQDSFEKAISASLKLFPDIIMVSGNEDRTFKTCETLAKGLALPICVDNRFDKHTLSNPQIGTLKDALERLSQFFSNENNPQIVLVGTSLNSILEWIKSLNLPEYSDNFEKILNLSSKNDSIPTVLIAGFSKENNNVEWIFDLPREEN
ncbi:hypothetical protein [Silvanigrella aquatica]|uniref:Uncharacterized protein n=1 Tax=Silvanigrella aquatica TaxID=1915309 RepID=A0A1L4D2V2_9BACT|nr:hypothetical protein [Silvanigrella aquatica]APJ04533.1 hypothetical protein AXG55_11705 [Silvanigrella aquatica]